MKVLDNTELRIKNIISVYEKLLFSNENIVGFGLGEKRIKGNCTNVPCLTIFVEEKLSPGSISCQKLIPKYFNGVITDVIAMGKKKQFHNNNRAKYHGGNDAARPALSGMSVNNPKNINPEVNGVITYALSEKTQTNIYLLSSAQVLAKIVPSEKNVLVGYEGDIIISPSNRWCKDLKKCELGWFSKMAPIYMDPDKYPEKHSDIDAAIAKIDTNTKENQGKLLAPGTISGKFISGIEQVQSKDETIFIDVHSVGTQKGDIMCTVGAFRGKIINRRVVFGNAIVANIDDDGAELGALGMVKREDNKFYGVGMCVSTSYEGMVVFTSLKQAVDYFGLELLKPLK